MLLTFFKNTSIGFSIFFDEFCLVYIDDIFIYIDGSRIKYQKQIKKIKTFAKNRIAIKYQQMWIRNKNDEIFGFHHWNG